MISENEILATDCMRFDKRFGSGHLTMNWNLLANSIDLTTNWRACVIEMCPLSWHTISDNVDSSIDSIAHDVFTKMSNSRIPWSGDILLNSSSRFVQCQIRIKTHAFHSGSLWPGRNKIIEPATLINILVLSPQRKLGEKIADESEISHTSISRNIRAKKKRIYAIP